MSKLLLSLLGIFISIGIIYYVGVRGTYNENITINKNTFWVQIVSDNKSRELGLSYRYGMCSKCGMLFTFDEERDNKFWMKDMKFDLDMLFIDRDKRIVGIRKDVKKESYPEVISSDIPSQYVLELNAGVVSKLDIKEGDMLEW